MSAWPDLAANDMSIALGKIGIWRRRGELTPGLAVTLERLGYGTIWLGAAAGDLRLAEALLDATSRITVATGIVNLWANDAATVASAYHRVIGRYPERFLLGVGVGHPEFNQRYQRPYAALVSYLDELDKAHVPASGRVLAALGPKVLALAAGRAAGAHPYLVTPEHTGQARELLGAGPLLAPEQKVVLEPDPERARAIARPGVRDPYLGLSNYVASLRRLGWTDADLTGGGSDRLVDALAPHGDAATIAGHVTAHLQAGADHVAVQVLGPDPLPGYQAIAAQLGLPAPSASR
jgi:probable F420-dependent oxidoreductase